MNYLLEVATVSGRQFPLAFTAVYIVGFIAAVGIGSIAWYNSKRPAGWEDKARPDFIPDVAPDKTTDEQ
ncbi:MAG: hypothetical protein J7647_08180 [Cyanobacteria bacterium SBLK]|nr:hypothetical protein [Cyanobacteria bacterium SBLK]